MYLLPDILCRARRPLRLTLLAGMLLLPGFTATADRDTALVGEVEAALAEATPADDPRYASLALAVAATLTEDAKLTASDADEQDVFGFSVSLSGDRALIGARGNDDGGAGSGSAYIFVFDGTTWSQEAKLTASDAAAGDRFGTSVSLSGDRALVGADEDDDGGDGSGSAYIFAFDGTAWTQQAKLTASDAAAGDVFGFSVSLSGDHALVGARRSTDAGVDSGSAYIFAFDGTTWTEQAKLTASDASPVDFFGVSVSLSGDRALIGANLADCSASIFCGAAYIFAFDGTTWSQEAKLIASDIAELDDFGVSVSLSGDRALVGASEDDDGGDGSGSAYIFAFDGTTWSQEAKLTASDAAADDRFGTSISLSDDRALIGAPFDDDGGEDSGSAYIFAFDGTAWTQQAKLIASDTQTRDNFGRSVSLSDDHALVGAYLDDDAGALSGSAYVFHIMTNAPPVADAGPDQTVECTAPDGTEVTLDGSASSDPDGDALTYSWSENGTEIATGIMPTVSLDLGMHTLTLTVDDGQGETATDIVEITVEDTTAPSLTVSAAPLVLWPANHEYHTVSLADLGLSASDGCDGTLDPGQVYLTSVSSDEPESANGDGNTLDDIVIDDCQTVRLRAERQGGGNGRVYTLTLAVSDASGNVSEASYQVFVPKSKKKLAVDDGAGAGYSVAGTCTTPGVVQASAGTVAEVQGQVLAASPSLFALSNYPNPFNPSTTISYGLPQAGPVRLTVYDALGREVAVLVDREQAAGRYRIFFEAGDRPSGAYFYRLEAGATARTGTMLLLK